MSTINRPVSARLSAAITGREGYAGPLYDGTPEMFVTSAEYRARQAAEWAEQRKGLRAMRAEQAVKRAWREVGGL